MLKEPDWDFSTYAVLETLEQCLRHETIREKAVRGIPLYFELTADEKRRERILNINAKRIEVTGQQLEELKQPFKITPSEGEVTPPVGDWRQWTKSYGELRDQLDAKDDTLELEKSTIVAFEVSWELSDDYWKDVFGSWLKKNRNFDIEIKSVEPEPEPVGGGSKIKQLKYNLKMLGAARLLDHYGCMQEVLYHIDNALGKNSRHPSFWSKALKKVENLLLTENTIPR